MTTSIDPNATPEARRVAGTAIRTTGVAGLPSPEELAKARLASATLTAAERTGVEGITRPELAKVSTGLGSSASIGEGIMNALAAKSPAVAAAERTATAAEATTEVLRSIHIRMGGVETAVTPGAS